MVMLKVLTMQVKMVEHHRDLEYLLMEEKALLDLMEEMEDQAAAVLGIQ